MVGHRPQPYLHLFCLILFILSVVGTTEIARCNSPKPYYNSAFSVVAINATCPIPDHLFIYKMCYNRLGIASDNPTLMPFPTDYLVLYQLNDDKVNIAKAPDLPHHAFKTYYRKLPTSFQTSSIVVPQFKLILEMHQIKDHSRLYLVLGLSQI